MSTSYKISTLGIMIQVPYYPLKRANDSYGNALKQAVTQVVDSGWYIRGEECKNFEENFASFCGARFCVGVGNGLEALALILKGYVALGRLQPGDAVIVPSNTFIATWLAVRAAGLVPMPAEPDEESCVLTLGSVEKTFVHAQYSRLKVTAILAVHLYGRLCPMKRLREFAEDRGLLLLGDAAQAHGAAVTECGEVRRAGNLGHAAGFSFYPGKNLGALGDGGAVVTNDADLADVVRKLANYGSEKKYVHEFAGENSRLDEIQAAVLNAKLLRLDSENVRRNEIANRYLAEIKNPFVRLPKAANVCKMPAAQFLSASGQHLRANEQQQSASGQHLRANEQNSPSGAADATLADCVWHIFAIHCRRPDGSSCRDELQAHLKARGVETLIHYPTPPHLQKAFVEQYGVVGYPIAERLAREELSLPLHPFMTEEEIRAVIDCVNSFDGSAGLV